MLCVQLGGSWGCFWGIVLRMWLPKWNVMPGLYAILAGKPQQQYCPHVWNEHSPPQPVLSSAWQATAPMEPCLALTLPLATGMPP